MASKTLTIVGNLTSDPELRYTQNGTAVASFTVASVDRVPVTGKPGEYQDGETLFMRCSIWRDYAENVAGSLHKGDRVVCWGDLKQDNWEKDGEKRSSVELTVQEMGPALRFAVAVPARRTRAAASQETQAAQPSGRRAAPVPEGQPF